MRRSPTTFAACVLQTVARIPRGRVATYGQIAALCGSPRAAHQVGWILRHTTTPWPKASRSLSEGRPEASRSLSEGWWRVINREGRLSIVHPILTQGDQTALLQKEGIRVAQRAGAYWVDLNKYLWNPPSK